MKIRTADEPDSWSRSCRTTLRTDCRSPIAATLRRSPAGTVTHTSSGNRRPRRVKIDQPITKLASAHPANTPNFAKPGNTA